MTDAPHNQEQRILWALQAAWPNWVPAPALAKISLQYSARIFSLRRKKGWLIENRVRVVDGVKHGFFRLGPRPIPASKELRRQLAHLKYQPPSIAPDGAIEETKGLTGKSVDAAAVAAGVGSNESSLPPSGGNEETKDLASLFGDLSPERYPD